MGAAEEIAVFRKETSRMTFHLLQGELLSTERTLQYRAHNHPTKRNPNVKVPMPNE